jgi:hypothetical protein
LDTNRRAAEFKNNSALPAPCYQLGSSSI